MSLITEIFGPVALKWNKQQAIEHIKSSPLIHPSDEPKYLSDWADATDTLMLFTDYEELGDNQ